VPATSYAATEKSAKSKKKSKKKTTKKKSTKKKKVTKKSNKRNTARRAAPQAGYAPKYAEFLVDGETGRILHQENASETRYPASLTKMMTIYLAFEQIKAGHLRMSDTMRVSAYAASMPKTNLALSPGDRITVRDAILGLMVQSANDAAVVLAENIGGDEDRFGRLMTERARQLGMKNTTFKNASGLHDPAQVTTAKDMALLGIALKRHYPEYYNMFSRTYFTYNGRTMQSHNRVTRSYSGAEGLKTGFIRASGFNLVTSASRHEGNLVGVVIGGRSAAGRDDRMKELLDKGFDKLGTMKKKVSTAGKLSSSNSLTLSQLAPASGGKDIKDVQQAIEPETYAEDSPEPDYPNFRSGKSIAKQQKLEKQVIGNVTVNSPPKHFSNNFIPAPKEKPKRLASL
jgi:D-alanyl-D-alanine carboxypeptidase